MRGTPLPPSEQVIDEVLAAAAGTRPGRHLRGRTGVARLREFGRPAQLARDDHVQPAVEPLSPRRQGGEDGPRRIRVGRAPRSTHKMDAGARTAGADQPAAAQRWRRASTARISRRRRWRRSPRCCAGAASPDARWRRKQSALAKMQDGRVARRARVRSPKTPTAASRPRSRPKASRGRRACRSIAAANWSGSLVSPRTAREFGLAGERRQRRRDARVAGDGGRHAARPTMRWPRSTPASRSATCGTSTTPTGPRAASPA